MTAQITELHPEPGRATGAMRPPSRSLPLSPADWIIAGFEALAEAGPMALRVEPLARKLGVSKGSFYWHFRDLAALQGAMLLAWEDLARAEMVMIDLSEIAPVEARARLQAMAAQLGAASQASDIAAIEPALRDWARHSASAAEVLARVDGERLQLVEALFKASGLGAETAHEAAAVFYAALIGAEALAPSGFIRLGTTLGVLLLHLLPPSPAAAMHVDFHSIS